MIIYWSLGIPKPDAFWGEQKSILRFFLPEILMCIWINWWFTRCWLQTCFIIFTPSWGRFPFWLIFFKWVEITNQFITVSMFHKICDHFCLFEALVRWAWPWLYKHVHLAKHGKSSSPIVSGRDACALPYTTLMLGVGDRGVYTLGGGQKPDRNVSG